MVNKAALIKEIAKHYDGNKAEATKALAAVTDTIMSITASDGRVMISGFGLFERIYRTARDVRNPATGEWKPAAETFVPRFRAGNDFKARVAQAVKAAKGAKGAKAAKGAKK